VSPLDARDTRDARDEVLARIRTALGDRSPAPPPVPREYAVQGAHAPGSAALLDLLAERLLDYRAEVVRCVPADLAGTVAGAVALRRVAWQERHPERPAAVAVPAGLDPGWLARTAPPLLVDSPDRPLPVTALDEAAGVVTGCAVAVAETGTLVLDGTAPCGRRVLTLVPDHHLVVVRADQVVGSVAEALARLDPRRPLTWISGPSATSDIELDRVEGVHGPRTLVVVLVEPDPVEPGPVEPGPVEPASDAR